MSQVLLSCRDLAKTFDGTSVLNHVSLDVYQGEILGLVGVHGAGKTTLINLISGQYPVDSGSIRFNGSDITTFSSHELAQLGMARTYQIPRPLVSLTVIDNLAVARMSIHTELSRKDAIDLSYDLLDFVKLGHRARLPVAKLNLTERKFLEMARVLALEPDLLLLDEVLAGLNPIDVERGIQMIQQIRESGITLVFVEHHMGAMQRLADRMVVLDEGHVTIEGLPDIVIRDKHVIATYLKHDYVQR